MVVAISRRLGKTQRVAGSDFPPLSISQQGAGKLNVRCKLLWLCCSGAEG